MGRLIPDSSLVPAITIPCILHTSAQACIHTLGQSVLLLHSDILSVPDPSARGEQKLSADDAAAFSLFRGHVSVRQEQPTVTPTRSPQLVFSSSLTDTCANTEFTAPEPGS
jgi:hypothetical protein